VLQLQIVGAIVVMSCLVLARLAAGRLDSRRRVTFEVLSLMTHYAVGQGLLSLAVIHGFPRGLA
jgi:cytochrome c oxidase subunit I+III